MAHQDPSDSSPSKSPSTFVFGVRRTAPVQPQGEETPLVPLVATAVESPANQLVEAKLKRKRKTKSEYAAMLPAEPKEKDKSKGGRPKMAEEEKLQCVSSLVSVECYDQLHSISKRLGISVSQVIRWLIDGPGTKRMKQRMGQLMKQGLSEEERKQLRSLTGMAANLNQLAKLAHTEGYATRATELLDLAEKIRELTKDFSK